MQFGIKRFDRDADRSFRYHLFDSTGMLLLVAEQISDRASDQRHHAVFAQPDGQQIASLDLTRDEDETRPRGKTRPRSYAVIFNHAVYAIINAHRATKNEGHPRWYFILEVEGEQWLVLSQHNDGDGHYAIYHEIPEGLTIYNELSDSDLPEPVGTIVRGTAGYDYWVDILPGQFRQMALVTLAVVFLLDRRQLEGEVK